MLYFGQYTLIRPTSDKAQPKQTCWNGCIAYSGCISQGCYHKVMAMSYQAQSRQGQISSKQLNISCFCWFFYNYVYFRCLWWPETYLDPNTDLCQNTPRDYKITIKGLEGLYPIDTNTWWHGLGLGFTEESAQGHGEVWSEHNFSKSSKNKLSSPVI